MKLYTKSDLERAARLSVTWYEESAGRTCHQAVSHAVNMVADDQPPYFPMDRVRDMLDSAYGAGQMHYREQVCDPEAVAEALLEEEMEREGDR